MTIRLSAPSKTFLFGEYAVLCGAPAVVLNTGPRFELVARRSIDLGAHHEEVKVAGIPTGSIAQRWLEQRRPLLQGWHLEFVDPHVGQGGFGASSAQFLLAHALTTALQVSVSRLTEGLDLQALWADFMVLSREKASGADVAGQMTGGLALVEPSEKRASRKSWLLPSLGFAILRTREKINTHEHLTTLDREPLKRLVTLSEECAQAFVEHAPGHFLEKLAIYSATLRQLNLQAPVTMQYLNELERQPWCLLAKGCGALGADTVLAFFNASDRLAVRETIAFRNWLCVATDEDMSEGLKMEWTWS